MAAGQHGVRYNSATNTLVNIWGMCECQNYENTRSYIGYFIEKPCKSSAAPRLILNFFRGVSRDTGSYMAGADST